MTVTLLHGQKYVDISFKVIVLAISVTIITNRSIKSSIQVMKFILKWDPLLLPVGTKHRPSEMWNNCNDTGCVLFIYLIVLAFFIDIEHVFTLDSQQVQIVVVLFIKAT